MPVIRQKLHLPLRPNFRGQLCHPDHPVTVYDHWRYGVAGQSGYKCWLKYIMANLGPKPSPKHSLDRYPNPGGNYEPGNIRWATAKEQRANQRPCRKDDQKVAT